MRPYSVSYPTDQLAQLDEMIQEVGATRPAVFRALLAELVGLASLMETETLVKVRAVSKPLIGGR